MTARDRRTGLAATCLLAGLVALAVAVTVSAWGLLVVPFALVFGVCAWRRMTVAQTWGAWTGPDDVGSGPAGLSP